MVKTVSKFVVAGAIALVAIACVVALLPHSQSPLAANSAQTSIANQASNVLANAQNDAINSALDNSGAKQAVENALLAHVSDISSATGLADSQVQNIINNMDIPSWEVATLPSGATETGSVSGTYAGVNAQVTTYDDPNYVSIEAYGQEFTLQVPQGAQQYMNLLQFVG